MGGSHFTGAYQFEVQEAQVNLRVSMREKLPAGTSKHVNRFIRGYLKGCGWKASGFNYEKNRLSFTMVPWPLHKQEDDRQRSEDFRQAARKKREENQRGRVSDRTPEP